MSSSKNRSTPDRDRERRKARDQRKKFSEMNSDPEPSKPLFAAPRKVHDSNDDISRKIQKTLGDFNAIQSDLNSKTNYNLLGIPKQPQTPVTGKSAGAPSFPDNLSKSSSGPVYNGTGRQSATESKYGAHDVIKTVIGGGQISNSSIPPGRAKAEKKSPGSSRKSHSNAGVKGKQEYDGKHFKSVKALNPHGNSASDSVSNVDTKQAVEEIKRRDDKLLLQTFTAISPLHSEPKEKHSSGNNKIEGESMKSPPDRKEEGFHSPPPVVRPVLLKPKVEKPEPKSPSKEAAMNETKATVTTATVTMATTTTTTSTSSTTLSLPQPSSSTIGDTAKPKFDDRPNGLLMNGVPSELDKPKLESTPKHVKAEKPLSKKALPKLSLLQTTESSSAVEQGEDQADVENILKEMTQTIDPLLTAIQTPIKGGELSKFPFTQVPGKQSQVYLYTHEKTTDPSAVKANKMGQATDMSASNLYRDLIMSDESDDDQASDGRQLTNRSTLQPMRHTPSRPHSPSSSSSGSSSSDSEDETDSDSDTSSSEASPKETKPINWALSNFMRPQPSSGLIQNNKHSRSSSSFQARDTANWSRNSPGKLSELGNGSNGLDNMDHSDSPPGFDPGGGDSSMEKDKCEIKNGISLKFTRVPLTKEPENKGKQSGKTVASKGLGKSSAKRVSKKSSSVKKPSSEKSNNSLDVLKSEQVKDKSKESKKIHKQSSKSEFKSSDGKSNKTPKQSTPKLEKSAPKLSEKKSKKVSSSSSSKSKNKIIKSKEYLSSDSDSDVSIDVVTTGSPDKSVQNAGTPTVNANSKNAAVVAPAHSSSALSRTSTPSYTKPIKTTPGKSKTKDSSSSKSGSKKSSEKSKSEISDEIKHDVSLPEPLLSPIQSLPNVFQISPAKPTPALSENLSKIEYVNGIPSLLVKLDLSLIEKVPSKSKVNKEREETKAKGGIDTSCNAADTKPPKLTKIPKRKMEIKKEERVESDPIECKKIKKEPINEFIHKSPKQEKPEPEHKEIGVKQEDSHEWDRKHPRRLSERRTSNSSVHSIQSTSSRKNDKDSPPQKKVKKEHSDLKLESKRKARDFDLASDIKNERTFVNDHSEVTHSNQSNGHKATNDWNAVPSSVHLDFPERKNLDKKPLIKIENEDRQCSANHYLAEAKDLKHKADAMTDKTAKALMYVDAVLAFIQCGNAMESDPETKSSPFMMYSQTSDLIRYILKFKGNGTDSAGVDRKLTVLCMRCQSLLCLRLFKLKKDNAMKFSKILIDHFKNPSKPNAQAPSPYHANWNTKYTGTPSPMSPTPSPAGSIGSCGSLGSNNGDLYLTTSSGPTLTPSSSQQGKLPNGLATPSASPATVSIPHRIHSIMYDQVTYTNYLLQGHDLWDQADTLQNDSQEFFSGLDLDLGPLTFHSSILDLVKYVRHGLHRLNSATQHSSLSS
ncbi:AF4/FMR2 family member 4-like isoform X2 [Ptychodera flava]|uniref:AF4/FMR2 family member 4-like isoform X2 n=1 Tax=Ptychodera flava TaxID=63121 RepID=UPI003969FF07